VQIPSHTCKIAFLGALLACALAELLRPGLFVCILPSYSDETASSRLFQALAARDPQRVCCLPAQPRMTLLETAALLDQTDLFVTGDTGVMHLAAAKKKIAQKAPGAASLQNNPRIVALFGGQIPAFMATARTAPSLAGAAMSSALFVPASRKRDIIRKDATCSTTFHPRS